MNVSYEEGMLDRKCVTLTGGSQKSCAASPVDKERQVNRWDEVLGSF